MQCIMPETQKPRLGGCWEKHLSCCSVLAAAKPLCHLIFKVIGRFDSDQQGLHVAAKLAHLPNTGLVLSTTLVTTHNQQRAHQ